MITAITAALLTACNAPEEKTTVITTPVVDKQSIASGSCYRYAAQGDTVILTITNVDAGNQVTGKLVYRLKEKDKNEGSIAGSLKDNILVADYQFMSEGTISNRQVAFKLQDNAFTEGFGEITGQDGKIRFKNRDSLDFSSGLRLVEGTCR